MARLSDKVAIITGAASGIGRGTAELFAEHGALLVLVDRDGPGLEAVQQQLALQGAQVAIFQGDVSESAVIAGVVALALERFDRIDVVFNNAGIMPIGDLASFEERTWDQVTQFKPATGASPRRTPAPAPTPIEVPAPVMASVEDGAGLIRDERGVRLARETEIVD